MIRVAVTLDRDTHATVDIAHPDGDHLVLVLAQRVVDQLREALDVAKDELERAQCLNWSPSDVCPDELWRLVEPFVPIGSTGRPPDQRGHLRGDCVRPVERVPVDGPVRAVRRESEHSARDFP